jgi:hypothetical protein
LAHESLPARRATGAPELDLSAERPSRGAFHEPVGREHEVQAAGRASRADFRAVQGSRLNHPAEQANNEFESDLGQFAGAGERTFGLLAMRAGVVAVAVALLCRLAHASPAVSAAAGIAAAASVVLAGAHRRDAGGRRPVAGRRQPEGR